MRRVQDAVSQAMIIPIRLSPPADRIPAPLPPALAKLGSNEVVLIELQGWLDVVEGEKQDGLVGILDLEHGDDKPILKIGHHHLEGKLVSLSKPLAVLAREMADEHDAQGEFTRYNILSVVRRKITFSNRPIPIVKRA